MPILRLYALPCRWWRFRAVGGHVWDRLSSEVAGNLAGVVVGWKRVWRLQAGKEGSKCRERDGVGDGSREDFEIDAKMIKRSFTVISSDGASVFGFALPADARCSKTWA